MGILLLKYSMVFFLMIFVEYHKQKNKSLNLIKPLAMSFIEIELNFTLRMPLLC